MLKKVAGEFSMTPKQMIRAFEVSHYLDPTAQALTRGSSRNPESRHKVILWVCDMRAALYAQKIFRGKAAINTQFGLLFGPREVKVGGRPSPLKSHIEDCGLNWGAAERQWYSRKKRKGQWKWPEDTKEHFEEVEKALQNRTA